MIRESFNFTMRFGLHSISIYKIYIYEIAHGVNYANACQAYFCYLFLWADSATVMVTVRLDFIRCKLFSVCDTNMCAAGVLKGKGGLLQN